MFAKKQTPERSKKERRDSRITPRNLGDTLCRRKLQLGVR